MTVLIRLAAGSFLPVLVFLATSVLCLNARGSQPAEPDWVKAADKVAFQARDSSGEVVFRDRLWLLGGWFSSYAEPPRDVWSSADGVHWERVLEQAPWKHADLPTSLVFDNRMWMMGGWRLGRLPGASGSHEVWFSRDGAKWEQATSRAGWTPRLGAAGVVFDGKMWILGGSEQYFFGTDKSLRNDVWCSSDGKEWKEVTAAAPWPPRAYHAAVAFDNKLWVFGGGNYLPEYKGFNDVWSSPDGAHWTLVTPAAPWPPRIWFSADVYRQRMWVLGGWSNEPSKNWNDVWHSADGKTWEQLKTKTIWSARHEQSAYVFQDKLWIVAGNAWPLVGDVWHLQLPRQWPKAE